MERLRALGYQSLEANDLYAVITEAAWWVTKDGGAITMVVPMAISFGMEEKTLRSLLERTSSEIELRHHDNRPDTTFKPSPVASGENRQRTTILTCRKGKGSGAVTTSGLLKWPKARRSDALSQRPGYRLRRKPLAEQWPRYGSRREEEVAHRMKEQVRPMAALSPAGNGGRTGVATPYTAAHYITVSPIGVLERREAASYLRSKKDMYAALVALNSHFGYAIWRWYGDGFDVHVESHPGWGVPREMLAGGKVRESAIKLGRRIERVLQETNWPTMTSGVRRTKQDKANLHGAAPDLIQQCDELTATALGWSGEDAEEAVRCVQGLRVAETV